MNCVFLDETIKNKKYISIFFILVLFIFLSMLQMKNLTSPSMEIVLFVAVTLIGIFLINYYTLHGNEVYKVAFLLIVLLGLFAVFLNPIGIVPDEDEHFARAITTSTGDFFPSYLEDKGFISFQIVSDIVNNKGVNPIDSSLIESPGNFTPTYFHSIFQQNPFYGYLAQAVGILIAELFSFPALFTFLFARLVNLILYAILIAIAIRKTPILKIPMLAMACMPYALYLAGSVSIDSLINGLSFIVVAYFLSLWKSDVNSIGKKELSIFILLTILLGFCKITYFAFVFLIFCIPRNKFKENHYKYVLISFFAVVCIALSWNFFYAMPNLDHSYRLAHFLINNVSPVGQIEYMLNNSLETFLMFCNFPNYISGTFGMFFIMEIPPWQYTSSFINIIYPLFIGALILLYPIKDKLPIRMRIGVLIVAAMVIVGTFLIQLLTWTSVGEIFSIQGVQFRYFIPLFILFPLILNFSDNQDASEKIDKMVFVLTLVFAASLVLSLIRFY